MQNALPFHFYCSFSAVILLFSVCVTVVFRNVYMWRMLYGNKTCLLRENTEKDFLLLVCVYNRSVLVISSNKTKRK